MAKNVIDVGEWRDISSKSDGGIPALGDNAYTCSCSPCKAVLKETAHWTSTKKEECLSIPIKLGDRVLVSCRHPGIVRYVGDLDSKYTDDQVFIGVKLDDPVGEHDGLYNGKRFFKCPDMHGIIVPIEQVHILTPRDGREIKVNAKVFSMPELSDLGSNASVSEELPRPISQTLSEGQLPASSCGGGSAPLDSSEVEDLEVDYRDVKSSLNDEGINRSAVFICDKPGSIAASIPNTKSGSDIKATLLKKLSSGGCVDCNNETLEQQDNKAESPKVCCEEEKKCASHPRVKSLSSSSKRCASAMSVRSPQCSQRSIASSKSASSALGGKKAAAGPVCVSKLTMSKRQPVKEENGPNEGEVTEGTKEQPPLPPTEQPQGDDKAEGLPSQSETQEPSLQVGQMTSYTGRLLSCLPPNEELSSPSPNTRVSIAEELAEMMDKFGDGHKAWVITNTIEKLKDAQERGKAEVEWQKCIDKLEEGGQFTQHFSKIKDLRKEVGMYLQMSNELEEKNKSLVSSALSVEDELQSLNSDIQAVDTESGELLIKCRDHPIYDLLCDALTLLGCEWKEVDNEADSVE